MSLVRFDGSYLTSYYMFQSNCVRTYVSPRRCSKIENFYRATHMHSADYAVARCLSVRHTPILYLNDYKNPQSFSTVG